MGMLTVGLQDHQYDVHIEENVYDLFSGKYHSLLKQADQIGIIADSTAASLHLPLLANALKRAGFSYKVFQVGSGESCKTLQTFGECHSYLLQEGFSRKSLLIAFGGGAVGDLTGFVAATFMRGIPFIQCPTTILSHDSAVGGKTAINMPEGKNMVGSFHQPAAVLFEPVLFETLPGREIRSGMAELIKHAFISDEDWSMDVLSDHQFLSKDAQKLNEELLKGIQVKADIVAEDVYEKGSRKFLNFGHTFGHAIEAAGDFGMLSHGESVAVGMAFSMVLSEQTAGFDRALTDRYIGFVKKNGYSFDILETEDFERLYAYMQKDKKAAFGQINFVLLRKFGDPFVQPVTKGQCESAFHELIKRIRTEVRK